MLIMLVRREKVVKFAVISSRKNNTRKKSVVLNFIKKKVIYILLD